MISINRHNYEAFLLDYIEGTLDAELVAELILFAEQNPDLNIELNSEGLVYLEEPKISILSKEYLKQKPSQDELSSLIIASIEGVADTCEQKELEELLKEDAAIQKEYNLFKKTLLVSPNIAFPDKNKLKHYNNVVILMPWISAAASILFLLYFLQNDPVVPQYQKDHLSETQQPLLNDTSFDLFLSNRKEERPIIKDQAILKVEKRDQVIAIENDPDSTSNYGKNLQPANELKTEDLIVINENMKDSIAPIELIVSDSSQFPESLDEKDKLALATVSDVLTVKEWTNQQIRNKVFNEERPSTSNIQSSEWVQAFVNGVDKVTRKDLNYKNNSDDTYKSYSFSFGKFEFSRTKKKKTKQV